MGDDSASTGDQGVNGEILSVFWRSSYPFVWWFRQISRIMGGEKKKLTDIGFLCRLFRILKFLIGR